MRNFKWLGRVAYFIAWPGISVYLFGSNRSRIVINSGDDILVVKAWLSNGKWALPGGGIHGHESVITGALRELQEETGLHLKVSDLRELKTEDFKMRGIKVKLHFLSAAVNTKSPVEKQPGEITDIEWINYKELNGRNSGKDALRGIAIWKSI